MCNASDAEFPFWPRAGRRGRGWSCCAVLGLLSAAICAGQPHWNSTDRDPLVKEAYAHFYDLDYSAALELFEQIHAAHRGDPQGTAMLLEAMVFEELYREDLLDTTFYANDGFLTGRHATEEDPKVRDRIMALSEEAIRESDERIARNPNDAEALYARGWARALTCAYVAMVERAYWRGFRLATGAKDDDERVLQLDPSAVDAKLVAGVYQYVVGALPFAFKLLIGFAGVTGSKARGLAELTDDGNRGSMTSVEARTAIALFLRREGRYREAIEVVRKLKAEHPRNYLFWLEEANLRKDAGEGMGAVEAYREIAAADAKANFFFNARMELTYFGLGEALRGQRHYADAAQAYEKAASTAGVAPELKARTLLGAGECRDASGQRTLAVEDYREAIDAGPNTSRADVARRRLREPYRAM